MISDFKSRYISTYLKQLTTSNDLMIFGFVSMETRNKIWLLYNNIEHTKHMSAVNNENEIRLLKKNIYKRDDKFELPSIGFIWCEVHVLLPEITTKQHNNNKWERERESGI